MASVQGSSDVEYQLYRSVEELLRKVYGYVDLEMVFSVIDGISRDLTTADLGFPIAYSVSTIGMDPRDLKLSKSDVDREAASKLMAKFKAFVRRKCTLEEDDVENRIDALYFELFKKLSEISSHRDVSAEGKQYNHENWWWSLYTTNYDLVLETYWEGVTKINDLSDKDILDREVIDPSRIGRPFTEM